MKAECEHKCRKIQVSPPFSGPEMRNISHFFWVKFTYLFLAQPLSYLSHSRYVVCSEGLKEMASKALQNRDVVKRG